MASGASASRPVIEKITCNSLEIWHQANPASFDKERWDSTESSTAGVRALHAMLSTVDLDTVSEISYRLGSSRVAVLVRDAGKWAPCPELSLDYDAMSKLRGLLVSASGCKKEPGMPASGSIAFEIFYTDGKTRKLPVRVSLLPAFGDWSLSLRLIKEERDVPNLIPRPHQNRPPLVNQPMSAQIIKESLNRSGLILVTGPTGQGKTTTCYSMLRDLATSPGARKNVVTLEDPVESRLSFALQVEVSAEKFDIAAGFRAILRHDPDVVFVGEVRSAETAEVVVQAAAAGILTIATVHAENITAALKRMMSYDINAGLFADSLVCVTNQRLERRLCPACSTAITSQDPQHTAIMQATLKCVDKDLRSSIDLRTLSPDGCPQCEAGESKSRIALFETVSASEELKKWIKGGFAGDIQSVKSTPYGSFRQGLFELFAQGLMDAKSVYLQNKFQLSDHGGKTSEEDPFAAAFV